MSRNALAYLELSSLVDEKVLWFEISVKDPPGVTVGQTTQQLKEEKNSMTRKNLFRKHKVLCYLE